LTIAGFGQSQESDVFIKNSRYLTITRYNRLYPGIAPGWVYYFRPTIAAFAITGTNPYY